jgi:signal transduction histidine kinase
MIAEIILTLSARTDLPLLIRIFLNTLINVFKASDAGDEIKASIENDEDRITFSINEFAFNYPYYDNP